MIECIDVLFLNTPVLHHSITPCFRIAERIDNVLIIYIGYRFGPIQ